MIVFPHNILCNIGIYVYDTNLYVIRNLICGNV